LAIQQGRHDLRAQVLRVDGARVDLFLIHLAAHHPSQGRDVHGSNLDLLDHQVEVPVLRHLRRQFDGHDELGPFKIGGSHQQDLPGDEENLGS